MLRPPIQLGSPFCASSVTSSPEAVAPARQGRTSLAAMDLAGARGSAPSLRLPPPRPSAIPAAAQISGLRLELAEVVHLSSGDKAAAAGPQGFDQLWLGQRPGSIRFGTEDILHFGTKASVYRARVFCDSVNASMVAKVTLLEPHDAEQLAASAEAGCLWPPPGLQLRHTLLREAVFGEICGAPTRAVRALLTPTALLTLHTRLDGDLFDITESLSALPAYEANAYVQEIALQLAEQLAQEHALGVVHSDIKLENVLVHRDGRIWLADRASSFGQWEDEDDVDASELACTLEFSAYEVLLAGSPLAWREAPPFYADVFSLGVTLLASATGLNPFAPAEEGDYAERRERALGLREVWHDVWAKRHPEPGQEAFIPQSTSAQMRPFDRALALLWQRAPAAAPCIIDMLAPLSDERPDAATCVRRLLDTYPEPGRVRGASDFGRWLQTPEAGLPGTRTDADGTPKAVPSGQRLRAERPRSRTFDSFSSESTAADTYPSAAHRPRPSSWGYSAEVPSVAEAFLRAWRSVEH